MRVASELGAEMSEPRFNLPISQEDRRWAADMLAAVPQPRIILNLGARWPTKRWPPEAFAAIGRRGLGTRRRADRRRLGR